MQPEKQDNIPRYPPKPTDVYLFGTCLIDVFFPSAGIASLQLLEREGVKVHYPQAQSCCGQPAFNSGYDSEAQSVAMRQLDCFPEEYPVIVPSASCAGMFKHHYPRLLAGTDYQERANHLALRIFELAEFLLRVCGTILQDKGPPLKICLHNSCSAQRELGVADDATALLAQLNNTAVVRQERATECCGFGGTFAVKAAEISNAMAQDKCASIKATQAELLISGDCGCLMNIKGILDKQNDRLSVKHIAEYLWERSS